MKHVAVFFDAPGFEDYPFTSKNEYRPAYYELAWRVTKRGAVFSIARGQDTYLGGMRFSRGWTFSAEDGDFHERLEPFSVDLIYNKGRFAGGEGDKILNHPELDLLCTDKGETARVFPELCPQSIVVRNAAELADAAGRIRTAEIVVKPVDGEEGKGIYKASHADLLRDPPPYPSLLQEYLDTSSGIPGLTEGMHDLRMIVVRGEIVVSYIRIPKPGSFLANISQGGSEMAVPAYAIPAGARELLATVEASLQRFPERVYCLDVVLAGGRWYIMELNSKPGITPSTYGPDYLRFQERLSEVLAE